MVGASLGPGDGSWLLLGRVLGADAGSNDTDGFVLGRTDGFILTDGTKLGRSLGDIETLGWELVRIENEMFMSSRSNVGFSHNVVFHISLVVKYDVSVSWVPSFSPS
jgi:hypothetical protein